MPASATVAAGQTQGTFTVTTTPVTPTTVTIEAAYGGATRTTQLTVTAPTATVRVSVSPASVVGGQTATGAVTLSPAAPTGGAVVTLAATPTGVAALPASVTVAAGQTQATFTIATRLVTTETFVTITATYAGRRASTGLRIGPLNVPPVNRLEIVLEASEVAGGQSVNGVVKLTPAPSTATPVTLRSNRPAARPTSPVTIPANQTDGSFTVRTTRVTASQTATLTATADQLSATAALVVRGRTGERVVLEALEVRPTPVVDGQPVTITVRLSAVATEDVDVRLSATPRSFTFEGPLTVPQDADRATLEVTAPRVTRTTSVKITASATGRGSKQATVEVRPR